MLMLCFDSAIFVVICHLCVRGFECDAPDRLMSPRGSSQTASFI